MATQEATQVRKYVTSSDSTLRESAKLGNDRLQGIIQDAKGDPSKLDRKALSNVVDDSQRIYRDALENREMPTEFEDAHHYMVSALGVRALATERLENAADGGSGNFKEALSKSVEDYALSDRLVSGPYLSASASALDKAGQSGDRSYLYNPRPFMDYGALGYKTSSGGTSTQSDPNALHGVEINAVNISGKPLYSGGNVRLGGSDTPTFSVSVTNGGEVAETGVPVEVVIDTKAERQSRTVTIKEIKSGGSATVKVSGFRPGELNETADVSVKAGPVKYEDYLKNNTIEGTVTFGL